MHKALSTAGLSLVAATALVAMSFAPAAAQTMQGQQQMQPQSPAGAPAGQAQVSDEKLESFAAAAVEIQTINEEARERMSAPGTAESPEDLQRQANEDIVEAVREEGLTVEEFNEIARQVQADPSLHSRVQTMMQQRTM